MNATQMINKAPPTTTEAWGFFGTVGGLADAQAAWTITFPVVTKTTGGSVQGVGDLLDSRHGRHFADDVANCIHSGLELNAAIVTRQSSAGWAGTSTARFRGTMAFRWGCLT